MASSRTLKMKITNTCLAAGGCGETLRYSETEAGRLNHQGKRTRALIECTAGLFRVYTRSS